MRAKIFGVIIFGIAFAFVEAAVVFYLRLLFNFQTNYPSEGYTVLLNLGVMKFLSFKDVLPNHLVNQVETYRELATIVMLFALGFLSGETIKQRVGAFLISFSTWDIFYYVFLHLITGWPKTIFDIDVYFLNPVPWVGPVITPVVISIFMFIAGVRLYLGKNKI